MAAWKSGSLADKIKGQAAATPAPTQAPAPTTPPSATPVASQAAAPERKPQTSPVPAGKAPSKNGTTTPEPCKAEPVADLAPAKDETRSGSTPPPEAKVAKDDTPKVSQPKAKAEVKSVDEALPKPSSSHGPAAVATVDVVKDEPLVSSVAPSSAKADTAVHQTNGPPPSDTVPAPARPIESDEPLVALPLNIATLVDKKFSFIGAHAIAPPPTPVVPIMPQPAKRSVDPVSAPSFAAPPYARPAAPIPPNYDAYQQQYAHQGYPNAAPVYGQSGYQAGYTPGYGYAPRGGGRGAYQTGLFNLPPYERGFRGAGYGGQSYNSYRGNAHYAAPPYYANGYRAPEETDGTQ